MPTEQRGEGRDMRQRAAREEVVDVAALIDGQRLRGFSLRLVLFAFLIVVSDGFDINTVAFVGPQLIRDWHIDASALSPTFIAGLAGILLGSPLFGYVGDRYGRKPTIILALLVYGAFTWAAVLCRSVPELAALRFLTGLGIGALIPNIIALVAEFAPRRLRGTMIILMFTGVSFGGAGPGPIAAWLVPIYGWHILFVIGGLFPILVAGACLLGLPESVKYLTVKGKHDQVARMLSAMGIGVRLTAATRFVIEEERQAARFSPKLLFAGRLALLTPLLWLLFATNMMVFFFFVSWTPTLLAGANLPAAQVALANSAFQAGGIFGGWTLCRPMDRYGLAPLTLLFVLAVPIVGAIGYISLVSANVMLVFVLLAGFCVLGVQCGLNALSGMIYPTSYRSNGSGWAFALGRAGSIAGLFVGGQLIALHIAIPMLYLMAALPLVVGTVGCHWLSRAYAAEFRGTRLPPVSRGHPLPEMPPAE